MYTREYLMSAPGGMILLAFVAISPQIRANLHLGQLLPSYCAACSLPHGPNTWFSMGVILVVFLVARTLQYWKKHFSRC